ncbi:hypothetical protein BJ742DRAFT_165855 [Cladochytrium replicatum]|nr:hypothetical protein BJ742DRAFT_165855 [Cladochytrium replicatum]
MSVRSPTGAIATITRTLSTVILSASAIPSDEQQTGVDLINVGDVIPTATGHHAIPTGGANSTDILGGASSILYSTDEVTFVAFQVAGFTLMAVNICFFAVGYGTKSWLFTLLLLTVFLSYFAAAIFWFMQARGMLAGFTDAFVDVTALGLITFSFTIFLWAFFLRSQKLVPYKKTRQCSTTVASGLSLTYLIFVTLAVFTQFSLYASTTVLTTNNGGKPASATGGSHNSTTSASGNSGDLLTTTYDNLLITSIQMVPYMVYVYPFSSALISVYILLAYYVPRLKLVPLGSVLKRIWTSGLLFLATEEALHFLHASLYPVDAALHKKVHALMTGLRFFLFVAFMNATATASGDLLTLPGDPSHAKFSARGDGDRNDPVPTYTSTDREAYALRDGPKIVIPPSRGDSPKGSHGMKSPTPSAARDGLKSPDPFPTRSASRGNGYPPRKGSANAVMPAPRDASANAGTYYSSRPQNPREYEREREREREREKEQRDRDRDRDWRDRDRSAGPASPRRPTSPLSSPTRRRYDDDDARDRRPSDGGRGGGERRPSECWDERCEAC